MTTHQHQQTQTQTQQQPLVNRLCPKCARVYNGAPALSRVDNKTPICPECGTGEAIEIYTRASMSQTDTRDLLSGRSSSNGTRHKEMSPVESNPIHEHHFRVLISHSGLIVIRYCSCGISYQMELTRKHFATLHVWIKIIEEAM